MYIGSTEDVYSRTVIYYSEGSIISRIKRQPTQKVYRWCLNNFGTYNVEIMMFCNGMDKKQLVELESTLTEYYDPELNMRLGNKGTSNMGEESKAIRCVETGVVYESIREAERITSASRHTISRAAHGKIRTAGKCHWEFVN